MGKVALVTVRPDSDPRRPVAVAPPRPVPLQRPGYSGAVLADWQGPDRDAFVAGPDAAMSTGEVLKDDASAHVVRLVLDGRTVVAKRFRHPDALRALRRMPRPSRARHAWRGSVLLTEAGVAVPQPLLWLERRRGPLRLASWFLAAHVDGREAPDALDAASGAERSALIGRLAALLACLRRAGLAHGDLKATNVLITAAGVPVLIDLHAVRRVRAGSPALRRDRARFLRNWAAQPALLAAFEAALEEPQAGAR